MTRFDADLYLDRIGCARPAAPSARSLAALQLAHLRAVPFENLDIHLGRPLSLDGGALFDKVVRRRRGGFCYELNGLFARLLGELGHDVTRVSCRTYDDGQLGAEHDHLALVVRCQGQWLVDVGFGDAFAEPLDLGVTGPQTRLGKVYRVTRRGELVSYAERGDDGAWVEQYAFTLEPRTLATFADRCLHHQRSPDSPFTQKVVCTRLTGDGRITLRDRKLIRTAGSQREESPIADDPAWRAALARHFDVVLDPDAGPGGR